MFDVNLKHTPMNTSEEQCLFVLYTSWANNVTYFFSQMVKNKITTSEDLSLSLLSSFFDVNEVEKSKI